LRLISPRGGRKGGKEAICRHTGEKKKKRVVTTFSAGQKRMEGGKEKRGRELQIWRRPIRPSDARGGKVSRPKIKTGRKRGKRVNLGHAGIEPTPGEGRGECILRKGKERKRALFIQNLKKKKRGGRRAPPSLRPFLNLEEGKRK